MKSRIFIVTLAAASLLAFGAYAKPGHGHGTPSVSISHSAIAVSSINQVAVATKGATVVQGAVVNQNSPVAVGFGF